MSYVVNGTDSFIDKTGNLIANKNEVIITISSSEDLIAIIKYLYKSLNEASFSSDWLGIYPDEYGTIHVFTIFKLGENFGYFDEDFFLKELAIFSNINYTDVVNALRESIKELDYYCNKYKLLME